MLPESSKKFGQGCTIGNVVQQPGNLTLDGTLGGVSDQSMARMSIWCQWWDMLNVQFTEPAS